MHFDYILIILCLLFHWHISFFFLFPILLSFFLSLSLSFFGQLATLLSTCPHLPLVVCLLPHSVSPSLSHRSLSLALLSPSKFGSVFVSLSRIYQVPKFSRYKFCSLCVSLACAHLAARSWSLSWSWSSTAEAGAGAGHASFALKTFDISLKFMDVCDFGASRANARGNFAQIAMANGKDEDEKKKKKTWLYYFIVVLAGNESWELYGKHSYFCGFALSMQKFGAQISWSRLQPATEVELFLCICRTAITLPPFAAPFCSTRIRHRGHGLVAQIRQSMKRCACNCCKVHFKFLQMSSATAKQGVWKVRFPDIT